VKLNALDKESIGIVEKMDQLFRVDRVARERGLTLEARHVLRNEESKPILERIKLSIEAARIGGLPQSARTKACEYTLKLWNRLTPFLDHPELELSNNATENSMRPVAIGRNYEQSGIMQSLTGSDRDLVAGRGLRWKVQQLRSLHN
jgi:transposase